jgi:hypothetical protein
MKRAQLEALLDKLAADAAVSGEAVHGARPTHSQLVGAMLILQALASGLGKVLEVLAEQHGGSLGPWFDEVELAAINDAKKSVASEIGVHEAALIGRGVSAVEDVFAEFRANMQLQSGRRIEDE